MEIDEAVSVSDTVGGFEIGSLESMPNQGLVWSEAAENSDGIELITDGDQKLEIAVVEVGSTAGAAEATIDPALEGFRAGSLVSEPNLGKPLVESVDISHGVEASVAVGGFGTGSLEIMLNQGYSHGEAEDIRDESELKKDGNQKLDITLAETGSTVAAADVLEGFQAGSLVSVSNPGGLLVESVDISHGVEISAAVGGFGTESLESRTKQGRLQGEAVEIIDEIEFIKEGDQKMEVIMAKAENTVGAVEAAVDADMEGFHAGSFVAVPSPGLQVESVDINHGGEISVALGGSDPENLESMPNQGQVEGEAAEISDESKHINDGDQKPDMDVVEVGSTVEVAEATIDPALEGFHAGSLVGVPNMGGVQVESVDISHGTDVIVSVGGFETESSESMLNQGQVWGEVVEISEECNLIKVDGQKPVGTLEATIDAALEGCPAGSLVGAPCSDGVPVESVDIFHGIEARVDGVSCGEENPNTNFAICHDLLDEKILTSVGTSEDIGWEAEDGSVGDQKPETEVVQMESMGGTAGEPDIVSVRGAEIEGLEVEPNAVVQFEVAEIRNASELVEEGVSCPDKNRSSANDVSGLDLLDGHLQATDGVLGHGDSGQNQAEVVVDFTVQTENMSECLSLGINEEPEPQVTVEETEVVDGSMVDSVSQTSLVDTNQIFMEEGNILPREGVQKLEPMAVDDAEVDLADDVSKDSNLADPFVEVQDLDSNCLNNNLMDVGNLVISGPETSTTVTAVEERCEDGHLFNGDSVRTGDFVTTCVGSSKVFVNVSARSSLFVETQAADTSSLDGKLIEKGGVMEDPILSAERSVPETSHMSEIQTVVSQGNEPVDSFFGDNKVNGVVPVGSLTDGNPGANAHEVESSPGRGRVDTESTVVKGDFSPPGGCFRELQARSLGDSVADFVMDASSVQHWEQEPSEGSERKTLEREAVMPWTSSTENNQCARYHLPPQDMTKFSISDLVWGKVKSHPWWPGQIFDPSDASELALKHQRKENFLVAYFGDKTFAWCDESQLKPFHTCFSQMETQSNSDVFVNAVSDILGEVSRRMELGMTCFCLPREDHASIKYQKVENAGIREGSGNFSFDRSLIVNYFLPGKLLEYIEALAQLPTGGADRLELVIAQSQLKAFYRAKGYPELPQFVVGGWLMENDVEILPSGNKEYVKQTVEHSAPTLPGLIPGKGKPRGRPSSKQKQIMEDGRKRKSLSELMEEKNVSCLANGGKNGSSTLCSSGKKNKVVDSDSAESRKSKKKRLELLGDFDTTSPTATSNSSFKVEECIDNLGKSMKRKQDKLGDLETKSPSPILSFKIGECIRRVASQLTGSPSIIKNQGETFQKSASKADHGRSNVGVLGETCQKSASKANHGRANVGVHDEYLYAPVQNRRTKTGISVEYSSEDEMLSQLCFAARDPMKGHRFLPMIISFFTDFRNFCAADSSEESKPNEKTVGRRGRKKKVKETFDSQSLSSDTSTPDHMKDSYWCDMVHHNSSEKGLMSNGLKRKGETSMRSKKKKRISAGQPSPSLLLCPVTETGALTPNTKHTLAAERSIISVEEKIVDTPTSLVLSFNSLDSLPSETNLIRIFSRYGPLKESETEVLRKTNRVKVVFKRRADAEIAFSSAGKFSIFGPSLVSYQLKYSPSTPKTSPCTSPQGKNDAAPTEVGNLEVSAHAETGLVSDTAQVEAVGQG